LSDLADRPARTDAGQGPFFTVVPEGVNGPRKLRSISKNLSDWLYYNSRLTINIHSELGLFQRPDETDRSFKVRLQQAAREKRDEEVDALEKKYDTKIERLERKLRKYQRDLTTDQEDYEARKREELIGIGESVVNFFLGRRRTRALSAAARKRRLTSQARQDIEETKEEVAEVEAEIAELEAELKDMAADITAKWGNSLQNLQTDEITPRRTDVQIHQVAVGWLPSWYISYDDGRVVRSATVPAYALPRDEAA